MSQSRTTLFPAFIAFVLIVVGILTWSASLASKKRQVQSNRPTGVVVCTQDVYVCPDGSSVGRQPPTCSFAPCSTDSWVTYRDPEGLFSFEFPSTWSVVTVPISDEPSSVLVSLQNPSDERSMTGQVGGSGVHVQVSRFRDMNSDAARGGSWIGMRTYTSLVDFLSERQSLKRMTGQMILGGQTGYSVSVGGAGVLFGIMTQRTEGIYEIDFPTISSRNDLGADEQHIIDSLRFGPLPTRAR